MKIVIANQSLTGMFGTTCFEVLSIPEENYHPTIIEIRSISKSQCSVTVKTIKSEYLSNYLGSGLDSIQLDYAS